MSSNPAAFVWHSPGVQSTFPASMLLPPTFHGSKDRILSLGESSGPSGLFRLPVQNTNFYITNSVFVPPGLATVTGGEPTCSPPRLITKGACDKSRWLSTPCCQRAGKSRKQERRLKSSRLRWSLSKAQHQLGYAVLY